jgi:hypothetical protein
MPSESNDHASIEVVSGVSTALVGAGVVTFALAPLALPILILTVVAVIPLLLPVLALGLLAAIVIVPIRLARRLRRPTIRPPRPNAPAGLGRPVHGPRPALSRLARGGRSR